MTNLKGELHIYMDADSVMAHTDPDPIILDYITSKNAALSDQNIVRTIQVALCSWDYNRRIFIHWKNECHEITLGECEGTDKEIRKAHNIMNLLLRGAFDWFRYDPNETGELH